MPDILKEFLRGAINALILSLTGIATLLVGEDEHKSHIGFLFVGVFFLLLLNTILPNKLSDTTMSNFEVWAWIGVFFSLPAGFVGPVEYQKYRRRKKAVQKKSVH